MSRRKIAAILLGIIGIAGILGAVFFYFYLDSPSTPLQSSYIRVYVNSTIYSEIEPELSQYESDLKAQGYYVDTIKWSDTNVTELRNNLTYYYNHYDNLSMRLFGAVLIGNMPYAMARDTSMTYPDYPIDLYLMDLDGMWNDENGNNLFDYGSEPFGDNLTEIFIGRINPNPLNNMNNVTAFQKYFRRNHEYRNGTLSRPHSALLYIDDSWSSLTSAWANAFTAYTNVTIVSTNSITNRTDYLRRYTQIYEWVHLFAHSDYTRHYFNWPYGSMEYVYNTDILNNHTKGLFYNLYCCYACNYIQPNNLGTQYLFSNTTLTILGSARSGGLDLYEPFYDSLKEGKVIGEAFRLWFHNPEIDTIQNKRRDISGTTILGDPLLCIV